MIKPLNSPVYNTNCKGFRKRKDSILAQFSKKQLDIICQIYEARRLHRLDARTIYALEQHGAVIKNNDYSVSLSNWGISVYKRIMNEKGGE